jgi:hypothetical protein
MDENCHRLTDMYTAQSAEQTDTAALLKNSADLCKDLVSLTDTSGTIYGITRPLLSAGTKAKRYQTLPFIKSHTVGSFKSSLSAAQKSLKNTHKTSDDYVQLAIAELADLQRAAKGSKDFSYLPALEKFQLQMLADRQHYWNSYADLRGLIATLQNQLIQYCNDSPSDTPPPAECLALENT